MTTNESFFFRDDKPFQHFRDRRCRGCWRRAPAGAPLRIWSAACSTGQEAYSLAMILAGMRRQLAGWRIEIVGTDLAARSGRAREAGIYTQFEVQRGLPVQLLMQLLHARRRQLADHRTRSARMVQFRRMQPADGSARRSASSTSCSAAMC